MPIESDEPLKPLEIKREDYLQRLPEVDRANLDIVVLGFVRTMKKMGRTGGLLAVGGTIGKPFPRKDIDIVIVLDTHPDDPVPNKPTPYAEAVADFKTVRKVVKGIVNESQCFKIESEQIPRIDRGFISPGILEHEGSITVKPSEGTQIELIRERRKGFTDVINTQNRKFVVLIRS